MSRPSSKGPKEKRLTIAQNRSLLRKFWEIKAGDGLYRRGRSAPIVFRAWKPDLILSVAQRHAACRGLGRLIACDMIGMGDSEKLLDSGPDRYTYAENRSFLFALWEKLGDR